MGKPVPVNLIVYSPKNPEGQRELAQRMADVHADAVQRRIKALNCPVQQKLRLLDAVEDVVKTQNGEQA